MKKNIVIKLASTALVTALSVNSVPMTVYADMVDGLTENDSQTEIEVQEDVIIEGPDSVIINGIFVGDYQAKTEDARYDAYCAESQAGEPNYQEGTKYVKVEPDETQRIDNPEVLRDMEYLLNELQRPEYDNLGDLYFEATPGLKEYEEFIFAFDGKDAETVEALIESSGQKQAVNNIIWMYMASVGVGQQHDEEYNDGYKPDTEFREVVDKLLDQVKENGKDHSLNNYKVNEIAATLEDGREIKWNADNNYSSDEMLVFKKEDGKFYSEKFTLEVDAEKLGRLNYELADSNYRLEYDETDGKYQVVTVTDKKPDNNEVLKFLSEYAIIGVDMYVPENSAEKDRLQTMFVAIDEKQELAFDMNTGILANLTIEKVDADTKEQIADSTTEFYLWYTSNEDTYYIINADDKGGFVKVKFEEEKESKYTLDVTGALEINDFLLEGIVYYLQEAVAPTGYDLDTTVQIICTEEQFKEIAGELDIVKVTNVAAGGAAFDGVHANLVAVDIDADGLNCDYKATLKVENSKTPEESETPEQPETPETPAAPEKPETSHTHSGSKAPASSVSKDMVSVMSTPEIFVRVDRNEKPAELQVLGAFETDEIEDAQIPLAVLPKTGDSSSVPVMVIFLAGIAAMAADLVQKRRRENN